jgi:hypothetical protein
LDIGSLEPGTSVLVRSTGLVFTFNPKPEKPQENEITVVDAPQGDNWVRVKRERARKASTVLPSLLTLAAIGASSMPTSRRSDSNASELPRIVDEGRAMLEADQKRARKAAKRARDAERRKA